MTPTRARQPESESQLATLAPAGLKGVAVAKTAVGSVRGEQGFYHYRQYDATALARSCSVEQVWGLLLDGQLHDNPDALAGQIGLARVLPKAAATQLLATRNLSPQQALCAVLPFVLPDAKPTLDIGPAEIRSQTIAASAAAATILGGHATLRRGAAPLTGDPNLSHTEDWIRMCTGDGPSDWAVRAVNAYLVSTMDHGFNASTFATRAVVSTGTDVVSALLAGVGSLAGPLHGGAPARALDMIQSIGAPADTAAWVRQRLQSGEKIMGFGHAVYRTDDPRSTLLRELALAKGGELVERAVEIEDEILAELRRWKPEATIATNVEYYAGVVLHLAGIPQSLFTPSFTVARFVGWSAHLLEQVADNKIIRPSAIYVGPDPELDSPA